jgi:sec-independent protein translocase protein TatA
MGSFSIWHWLVVGAIILILFGGRGRISDIMGDVARGIKSFRKGLSDEEKPLESGQKEQTGEKERAKN